MPRIERHGELLEIMDCPSCGVTVYITNRAATGFLAECGRRLVNIMECRGGSCPRRIEEKKHAFSQEPMS